MGLPSSRRWTGYIVYSVLAAVIGAALVFAFHFADDGLMAVLLKPHAHVAGFFYNLKFYYVENVGYSCANAGFVIGRDCFGMTFIVMVFCLCVGGFAVCFRGAQRALWVAASLVISVVVGVGVSCIRIVGSIPFVSLEKFATLHTGIGAALYLMTLAACYLCLKRFVRRPPV